MRDEPKTVTELASMGGQAAAKSMTKAQKRDRGRKAAHARWSAGLPRATHGSDDHPMKIGDIEIPCYVLDNGLRVVTHRGLQGAVDMAVFGGASKTATFVGRLATKGLNCQELMARISSPIEFVPANGRTAYGYEATVLVDFCDLFLEARRRAALDNAAGERIAARCEMLARGFARVGIIALVDEATGYQEARESDALAKILEAFVAKELRNYMRTFEPDYYRAICKLRGWEYKASSRRPRVIAHITNDIVYSRLAPGVLDELRDKNPIVKAGRRGVKHFQWLSDHKGHPELQKHLHRITGWMEMAESWDEFYKILNEKKPVYRVTATTDIPPEEVS